MYAEIDQDASGTNYAQDTDSNSSADGLWHQFVATRSGTNFILYRDGVQVATGGPAATTNISNATTLTFAKNPCSDPNTLNGTIDDVRIYNRTLSATEVANLYQSGSVKFNASSASLTNATTLGPANGLVGLWTFDGGDTHWTSGTTGTTDDRSGNGNTGTLTNMNQQTTPTAGHLGQALNFDGTTQDISAAASPSLNNLGPFTAAVWIYPTVTQGSILYKSNGDVSTGWNVGLSSSNGDIGLIVTTNGIDMVVTIGAANFPMRQWHQLAITWDGTLTAVSSTKIYVDGVEVTSHVREVNGTGSHVTDASNDLHIGHNNDTSFTFGGYFGGSMDDLRIYNRALSATEVKQLYHLGTVTIHPN